MTRDKSDDPIITVREEKDLGVTFDRPHLEYGSSVWPVMYEKDSTDMETVQRRATKLLPFLRTKSYSERLKTWDYHHNSRPRWLNWMRRPTGDQEVAGSTPAEVGNILSWRLIMKYFLRSFSPFR